MKEHDDFRQGVYERESLIQSLRTLGAVDLEFTRGAGFGSERRIVRKAHVVGGSGQYIGSSDAYWLLENRARQ